MNMKSLKFYILVALLVMAGGVTMQAQNYDSIAHHNAGWYDLDLRNMMQLRDGNILANIQLFEIDEQGNYIGDYGNRLLKIAPNGAVLLDSVFVADDDLNYFLLERNPFDEDNIYAKVVRNLNEGRCDLRISFFDDDLNFYPEKEVWVPLSDTVFSSLLDSYFLDEHGDIILRYPLSLRNELHYYRIGIDGTVKDHVVMPKDGSPINYYPAGGHRFGTFNESPTEYCFWGINNNDHNTLYVHVFDSLLNLKETLTPNGAPSNVKFEYGMRERVLDWDAETFLVASRFDRTGTNINGVRVTRYRKNTLEALNTCYFRTKPELSIGNVFIGCAFPIGLAKAGDGDLYFAYCTQDPETLYFGSPSGQVSVVKMDADFNIIWQRFCLEPEGYARVGSELIALENGGVAVGGVVMGAPPELFFLAFDDEGWAVSENAMLSQTCNVYPNPAREKVTIEGLEASEVQVYNALGQMVKMLKSSNEVSLEGLPQGVYLLRIMDFDGQIYASRVSVSR